LLAAPVLVELAAAAVAELAELEPALEVFTADEEPTLPDEEMLETRLAATLEPEACALVEPVAVADAALPVMTPAPWFPLAV